VDVGEPGLRGLEERRLERRGAPEPARVPGGERHRPVLPVEEQRSRDGQANALLRREVEQVNIEPAALDALGEGAHRRTSVRRSCDDAPSDLILGPSLRQRSGHLIALHRLQQRVQQGGGP
jgi:hypothetical protein